MAEAIVARGRTVTRLNLWVAGRHAARASFGNIGADLTPYPHVLILRPALVNGAAGVVVMINGQPFAVMGFTVTQGQIVEIDCLLDPERLARLDLAGLDGAS